MNNNFLNGLLAAIIMIAALLVSSAWIYTANKYAASSQQKNQIHDREATSSSLKSGGCGI